METVMERQTYRQQPVFFDCPVTVPYLIPVIHSTSPYCINVLFMVDGEAYYVTSFSLQKPYGVVITEKNIDDMDISLPGMALSTHPLFPLGADIVFVEVERKDLLKVRLYGKDQGELDFSEQGASAAFIAARMMQKTLLPGANVAMGGKNCRVEWDGAFGKVKVTGINN